MNISTSFIDVLEIEAIASIMDITEDQYSGSAAEPIEFYDVDGNLTGYANTTTYTQADGYSYVVTESFDANGTLTQSVTSDSSPTQYLISYDSDGNVTGYVNITSYLGDDGIYYTWTDSYDANWSLTKSTYSDSTGIVSSSTYQTSSSGDGADAGYTYSTSYTDADGFTATWTDTYDANMTLTQSTYCDSSGQSYVSEYHTSYDSDGAITGYTYSFSYTEADGATYTWSDSYDADWSLTQSSYSDSTGVGSSFEYLSSYDGDGNFTGYTYSTSYTDADGFTATWTDTYDANMTLTHSAYSDSSGYSSVTDVTTSHDADGNITGYTYTSSYTDADGFSYSWTDSYDADWSLTQSSYSDSTGYSSVTAYGACSDADGNLTGHTYTTAVTDADGLSCSWTDTYDADWSLTQSSYSDSTGYSSVTLYETCYNEDGIVTGYTCFFFNDTATTEIYTWTDRYDAQWNVAQSAYSDESADSSGMAADSQTETDGILTGDYVDDFVFTADAESTVSDATDAYLMDQYSQSGPENDAEYQTCCDTFMFDWTVTLGETGSFADSSFI